MEPSDKAEQKFKQRTKEITRRNQTTNVEALIKKKLKPYLRGWGNYFVRGNGAGFFKDMDGWIRRRLRAVQMRSWRHVLLYSVSEETPTLTPSNKKGCTFK
jgi:RNA-directed DNA polymerase